MSAPVRPLLTTRGTLALGGRPWLMGIVNATPDSFSDAGLHRTLADHGTQLRPGHGLNAREVRVQRR